MEPSSQAFGRSRRLIVSLRPVVGTNVPGSTTARVQLSSLRERRETVFFGSIRRDHEVGRHRGPTIAPVAVRGRRPACGSVVDQAADAPA